MMIHSSYINCKIELIENYSCDTNEELQKRKNEIYDKLKNKTYIYIYICFKKI